MTPSTSPLRAVLASKLRHLMATTPLTSQRKVADASGVAQSTVGRILAGDVAATLDNIGAIAGAFGVAPVTLLATGDEVALSPDSPAARLFSILRGMPHAELEKVLGFAGYVASETVPPAARYPNAVNELSAHRVTEPAAVERGAIQRGARAPLRRATELNHHDGQRKQSTQRRTAKDARRSK